MELPYDPLIPLWGIYPKNPETSKEYVHPYVHSSAIYNSRDLETAYVPISRWVDIPFGLDAQFQGERIDWNFSRFMKMWG